MCFLSEGSVMYYLSLCVLRQELLEDYKCYCKVIDAPLDDLTYKWSTGFSKTNVSTHWGFPIFQRRPLSTDEGPNR
jgi:hypothetical protein